MKRKKILSFAVSWILVGALDGVAEPGGLKAMAASSAQRASAPTAMTGNPAPQPGPKVGVKGVSITCAENSQETMVDIAVTRPPKYKVFQLENPPRLVVDFEGAQRLSQRSIYTANSPFLKRVRIGRFSEKDGGIIRVVADLEANPLLDVHTERGGLRIELRSRHAATRAVHSAPAPPTAVQSTVGAGTSLVSTKFAGIAQTASAAFPPPLPAQRIMGLSRVSRPSAASMDHQGSLPARSGSLSVTADPNPPLAMHDPGTKHIAQAAQVISADAASAGVGTSDPLQSAMAASTSSKYTGEPISLNLKDVDVKDFFRLIHEISGLNVVVDPDVTGSVTMVLDHVPWDQALDLVLQQNGLGRTLEGNILRISRLSTLASEQQATAKVAAAKIEAAPLVTVFRPLNYAKATTVSQLLKSWVGGGALSSRGSVLVDDRTNTLIISDITGQIPVIENIVSRLDTKSKQVLIEARIIRGTTDFTRSLQSALAVALTNHSGSTIGAGATGTGVSATTATSTSSSGASAITAPVTASSASGFGVFLLRNQSSRYIINAAIAAAEEHDEAKTISRPSIVTQDNVKGEVLQGTQIPVQTTINNTVSIQYVQASLQLDVTPQVTQDGNVFLDIQVTNASVGAILTNFGPSINTQKATTQVLVPDGGTVVFGGVTITTRSKAANYVPVLGSIPILGHLFKNSNVSSNDQELLFFVTPKILPG